MLNRLDLLSRLDLRGAGLDVAARLPRPSVGGDAPVAAVRQILADVRAHGDAAVRACTERFDGVVLDDLRVPAEACRAALERIDGRLRAALHVAAEAIEAYHRTQVDPPRRHVHRGIEVRSLEVPVDRAGCYVPGGRAIYPSTVLMTAVPARVAGVPEVVLAVPPDRATGLPPDPTLAAAAVAGVDEVYRVGGAQAIGALAYGTESIRPVDVIVGPGNVYVAVAKREVAADGRVGIPSAFAGPSEVVVVADATTPVAYAAVDVVVQAEHGPHGLAWLVTWDEGALEAISAEVDRIVAASPRRADIEATLADGGWAVLVDGPEQALAVANAVAPEHLELLCADADALVPLVRHAGAVFCGPYSPASLGDYLAGPSHVLPTFGSARFGQALTVSDFTKHVHVVTADQAALAAAAPHVIALAETEGLAAHADSVRLRAPAEPAAPAPAPTPTPAAAATPAATAAAIVPVRDDLRALEGYHSPQVSVSVRLNTNESPAPPPPSWRDALAAEVSRLDWHRYPDRQATALRAAIADLHGVRPDQVFAANGSNEVLQTLLLAYGGHGRTVATFEPTYQLHSHIAHITGTAVAEGERAADFALDLGEVRRVLAAADPVVTFLCSPNNPTGMVEPEPVVREVLDLAPAIVVVDEAYGQFAPWSALGLVDDERPLVVTRTFSKTWSMAAARLGYLVGPAWLVAELDKVVLPYHLDAAKQVAGRLALRYTDEMEARVKAVVAERERVVGGLAELPVRVWPSGANFVLFRPEARPGRAVWEALLARDVLVRDCSSWPRLDGCLRVTIGTPEEDDAFLTAITEVLA